MYLLSLFFIGYFFIVNCSAKPSDSNSFHCQAKDASVNECIKKGGQQLFKKSDHGFKDLGIPKMDPLFIPSMSLHNAEGPISLNLDLINSTQKGLSKSQIVSVNSDPEHYKFEIHTSLPEYNIKGMYNVSGKILMLPIMGTGPSEITFTGLTTTWKFQGEPVVKNNKKYMKITDFKFTMKPTGMRVRLENLFNGNKQLGDTMNKFLNENWEEVFKQLQPGVEESFSLLLQGFGNRALSKIPYSQIFSDMA